MVGLPSKYAKMGFKRGWRAFRKSRSSPQVKRAVVAKVARRRRTKFRAVARSAFRSAKRRYGRKGVTLIQPSAMVYGAGRGYALRAAAPLLSKLPIPEAYKGTVGAAALSWGLAKFGSGFIRDVGISGLTVENAMLGANLSGKLVGGAMTASGSNASTNGWV